MNTDKIYAEKIAGEYAPKDASKVIVLKKLDRKAKSKEDYLLPYLQFIRENKKVYRADFRNPNGMRTDIRYGNLKKYILEPILKKFEVPDGLHRYYIAYYIEGTTAIIKEWLKEDCGEPAEMIAAIIEECVRPSVGAERKLYGK